jgi:hypothetical protein
MSLIPRLSLVGVTFALGLAAAAPAQAETTMTANVDLRSGDTVVRSYDCVWTGYPSDPDCAAVLGDAPAEIELIKRNGADSAAVSVRSSDGRHSTTSTLSQRDDGTWLFVGTNHVAGISFGYVCNSAGVRCVPWKTGAAKARGARPSASAVKAKKRTAIAKATKKLRSSR